MGKVGKTFRALWVGANAISTLQWLFGLLPASAAAVITGWVARTEHLPPVVIGVLMLTVAAVVYVSYVAVVLHRRQDQPRFVYDVDPAPERAMLSDRVEAEVVKPPTQGPTDHQRQRLSSALADIDDLMRDSARKLTDDRLYKHGEWRRLFAEGPMILDQAIIQFNTHFELIRTIEELEDKHAAEIQIAGLTSELSALRNDANNLTMPLAPVVRLSTKLAQSGIADPAFVESHMEAFRENADRWLAKAGAIREAAREKRIAIEGRSQ